MGKQFADAPESKAALTIDFVVVFLFSDWLNRTFLGASTLLANACLGLLGFNVDSGVLVEMVESMDPAVLVTLGGSFSLIFGLEECFGVKELG